ncbi:MAG: Methyl-coenzyme M reductase operon protein C [Candidatus Argoarchaeum ethanivorans]|uniref:Methyl-coenzyme M reductase operon protein C n=1 Tax=Candidatus Argoarchaeum ethanivorans TaxID=2608793 RepID=A0A812A1K9_9EURY|nr:MAG: Methyl-coenzyme M reductase operon protein C [Candidatus Argoarchaeum ethanivorans]
MEFMIYRGAPYKYDWIIDLVEDVGGFIISKSMQTTEVVIIFAVPKEDVQKVEEMSGRIFGDLKSALLAGTEIIMVSPSYARHHSPMPHCGIIQNFRENGAKVDSLAMARGVGLEICRMSAMEKSLIEEHDLAVFLFGSFEHCIKEYKLKMIEDLNMPIVVMAYPPMEVEKSNITYVDGLTRILMSFRKGDEQARLNKVTQAVLETVKKIKEELKDDPLVVPPIYLKQEIEQQIPAIETCLSPAPVTLKLDSLRIKLPYETYADDIKNVHILNNKTLTDAAEVSQSYTGQILVKMQRESTAGSFFGE